MGKRGFKKQSPKLKIVKGTAKPEDRARAAIEPSAENVKPPVWLDEFGLVVWNELAPSAINQGSLTDMDVPAFAEMCRVKAELDFMVRQVNIEGFALTSDRGSPIKHPLLSAINANRKVLKSYFSDFGFTPGGRSDLPLVEKPEDDLEQYVR